MDSEQHSHGTGTTLAFINLALALGLLGRPGSGFASLTGQGNGQGGREHGQKADQLAGSNIAVSVPHATQWAEEEGTLTNLEGRVLHRSQALDPPPGVRSDLAILRGHHLRAHRRCGPRPALVSPSSTRGLCCWPRTALVSNSATRE